MPPFNDEVPVEEWMRQELDYERERLGELPGTFARGTRLYWTCAVHVPELDCEVISGWVRQEMR